MGWLFYDATNYKPNGEVDRKKEIDTTFSDHYTLLKSSMVGTVYYAAARNERTKNVVAYVVLTSSDKRGGFNFGYKDMSENMGPCEATCPKSILKLLTPTDNEYAKSWRERCWAYHEKAKSPFSFKNLPIGTKVLWTVPHEHFANLEKGEQLMLEKYRRTNKGKAFWVCWDKYVRYNPKFVNMDDVEFLDSLERTPKVFLDEYFQDSYCCECGGDSEHHTAVPLNGNWFARCDYPPTDNGDWHPIINEFRLSVLPDEDREALLAENESILPLTEQTA